MKAGLIVNTYDLISAETKTEKIFEQLIEKASIDIIKLNMCEKLTWFMNKKLIN